MLYYNAYREGEYYNHPYINTLLTESGYYTKKVVGIMTVALETEGMKDVNYLIQRGYKMAWNRLKQRDVMECSRFMDKVLSKYGEDTSDGFSESINHMIVLIFLCSINDIPLHFEENKFEIFKDYVESDYRIARMKQLIYNQKTMDAMKERVDAFNQKYPTTNPIRTIGDFFDEMVDWEINKVREEYPNLDDINIIQKKVYQHPWSRFGLSLVRFLGGEGINGENLMHAAPFSKKELDEIVAHAGFCIQDYRLKEEEIESMVLVSLFIRALVTEYKKTQQKYFDELSESYQEEIESYRKTEALATKKARELEDEILRKDELNRDVITQQKELIKKLERENKRLKDELEQRADNSKELYSLREFMFSMETAGEIRDVQEITLEEKIEYLRQHKCVVLGGHPNWVKKIKEHLPGYTYISPDQKTADFSFMDKADAVFINTSHNSHVIYEKAMGVLRKNDVPLYYINEAGSLDKAVNMVHAFLKQIKIST